jgi:diguanylate cyclase (GGDEF)-like protein/PAS domain S-box-containing protein
MRTEEALELLCSAVRLAGPGDFLLCRLQQQEEGAAVVEPGYILGASPLAAALLDKDERVIYTNPAFERLLGYGERELLRTALPFALPEKPAFRKQPVRVEVRDKSGKPFELDLFASVLGKEPGSARTLLLFADRSTERQEQEQLRKDGQRYRSMVEATSALLLLLDGEGRIAYANPAVEKNLGLAAQHLQGAPVSELLPDLDLQPGQRASVSLPTPEGSHQEFAVIVEMLEDPAQKLLTAHKANGTNSSGAAASSAHTALIEEISDLVLVLDQQLRVQWMNRAAEDFYGFARNTVHGKPWTEAWGQWLQVPGRAAIGGQVEQAGAWRGEVSSLSPQGREYVHDVVFRALADGSGYVAVWRDLTESKRALDSFRASQAAETLNSLGHKDGMVDWNLRTQEIYLSPRWKEMLGFGPGDLLDAANPWYAVVHPADLPTLRAKVAQHLGGGSEVLEADYRALHRSGEYRWMRIRGLATRNTSGEATRLVCLQSDVEEQKQSDEQLLFEAFHDSTTGLANRALLLERIAGSLGGNKPLGAVVFADLQQFAATNEMLGPAGGDAALAEAARRIAAALPEHSFLARHGSDEFAALLPPLTNGAMEELSNHIRFALAKPFSWKGKECTFDLHLGFANLEPGLKAEEQLSRASQAMAAAKQLGQPFAIYASSSPTSPAETPKACGAQEILDGIAQGEFRVFYHPVITLDTGEVAGLEALVRWQHPQRGLLAPKDFLPAAESSGAILALDRWVLREACAKAAELNTRFRRAETLVLTVNLSAQHFQASDWTSLLEDVIRNSDINPRYLRLELNSRGLHQNANLEALRENLQRVRVQVSVDDVDSTAASAENWDGLPVDRVKLLPSLVSNLAAARQREKVRGIIAEAESRGLQVVAGGVETLEQLAALRELRCHLAQGFYFAKPAPANDTERLLARSPRW